MCRCALVVTSVAMTALNYSGLDIVGKSSEVVVVVVVLPFVVLGIMGVPKMNISNWSKTKPLDEVDWLSFMNIMFWNLNSWDSVSTLAGEVRNPSRLFPRALLLAIQLVRLCLPLVHACVHRA
jgi:amino acid transporter